MSSKIFISTSLDTIPPAVQLKRFQRDLKNKKPDDRPKIDEIIKDSGGIDNPQKVQRLKEEVQRLKEEVETISSSI